MESAGPQSSERLEHCIGEGAEREDPALVEKKIESEHSSHSGSPSRVEKADGKTYITEEDAFTRARSDPTEQRLLYIIFSPNDRANPRNWPKWKKWYITCFASLLNILTCLCAGGYSSGVSQLTEEFHVSSEVGTLGLSMYILVKSRPLAETLYVNC